MHDGIFSDSPTYTRGCEIATSPPLNKLSVFRTFEVVFVKSMEQDGPWDRTGTVLAPASQCHLAGLASTRLDRCTLEGFKPKKAANPFETLAVKFRNWTSDWPGPTSGESFMMV